MRDKDRSCTTCLQLLQFVFISIFLKTQLHEEKNIFLKQINTNSENNKSMNCFPNNCVFGETNLDY